MEGIMSLVNVTEYAGFTIKEWNIVQFSKLSSVLAEVARDYKEKNLSWDSFSTALSTTSEGGMLELSQSVLDVLEPFTKHAPILIGVSCNAKPEQLEKISWTDGLVLLLLVLKFNMEHLSRFFVGLVGKTNSDLTMTDSTLSSNS